MRMIAFAAALAGCGSASVRFQLANDTPSARSELLADGTSLRIKMIAVYLAEDVDPVTSNNVGNTSMVWLHPECEDDISSCNVDGFAEPAGGPRVTSYFDFARSTAEVNAELNSQDADVAPGSYRYARVEMCKGLGGQTQSTVPTVMWRGPHMADEQPFTSGDCGRTSLAFDPPLELAVGDAVAVTLAYDLARAVASGAPRVPGTGCGNSLAGDPHCYRSCVDDASGHRDCLDFPDFAPSASLR